jgi:hypothetical protein
MADAARGSGKDEGFLFAHEDNPDLSGQDWQALGREWQTGYRNGNRRPP